MIIIGIDEAGYGAIAGPLVIAATAYPKDAATPSIQTSPGHRVPVKDSKRVRTEHLDQMAGKIRETAMLWYIHAISPTAIDAMGGPHDAKIAGITLVARRMVERLHITPGEDRQAQVIVDGLIELDLPFPYEGIPKADDTIWQVSAASVLAKREQVMLMEMEHTRYHRYKLKSNKGYPTQDHLRRLEKYGPCRIHRRSTKALAPWRKKPKGRE